MSLLVVGSVAIDSVEAPGGHAADVVGGAALYFSLAASFFSPVRLVGVVGPDFPRQALEDLRRRGVDLTGLEERPGRTFRWSGRYHEDVNVRDTLHLDLGVFGDFRPTLPDSYRESTHVFLANIDPVLQASVLEQLRAPAVVGCDTMNHWIAESRPALEQLLRRVHMLVINDEEARLLSGERNIVKSAARILQMGPPTLLIKRGEYGIIQFGGQSVFAVPAYPLEEVTDPTGAGDCFAGGFMGELTRSGDTSPAGLRRAIVYGSVMGSFVVEDFGPRRLLALTREDLDRRYRQFISLTEIECG